MSGQVFAVASGKGGVGKTTTVVNLGVTIRAEGHSVALVDADLGMANLGTVLGVDHEPTLHDVLAGRTTTEEATVEQADRFAIVPGSRDLQGFSDADPSRLRGVVEDLSAEYDYVIIDTGAGLSHEDLLPLGLADEVLLITTPDSSSVGDTKKVAGFSDILGKAVRGLVVTKSRTQADADSAAAEFDTELLAVIPDDPNVVESTSKGVPLEVFDSNTPAAQAYRQLAKQLTGETITADQMPDELEEPDTDETETAASEPDTAPGDEPATTEASSTAESASEDDDFPSIDADGAIEGVPTSSEPSPVTADDGAAAETDRPDAGGETAISTDPTEESSAGDAVEEDEGTRSTGSPPETETPAVDEPAAEGTENETGSAPEPEAIEADTEGSESEPAEAADGTEADQEGSVSAAPDEAEADTADTDSGPDESVEPDEQKSKGFFGRLFGVFR